MKLILLLFGLSVVLAFPVDSASEDLKHDDVTHDVTDEILTSSHVRDKRSISIILKKLIVVLKKAIKALLSKLPFNKLTKSKLSSTVNRYAMKAAGGSRRAKEILKRNLPRLVELGGQGTGIAAAILPFLNLSLSPGDVEEDMGRDELTPLLSDLSQRNTGNIAACPGWIVMSGIFIYAARVIL